MADSHAPLHRQEPAAMAGSFDYEEGGCTGPHSTGRHKLTQWKQWALAVVLGVTVGITCSLLLEPLTTRNDGITAFDHDGSKDRLGANHVKMDPLANVAAIVDRAAARHDHGRAFAELSQFVPLRSGERVPQATKSPIHPGAHVPINHPIRSPSPSRAGFISANTLPEDRLPHPEGNKLYPDTERYFRGQWLRQPVYVDWSDYTRGDTLRTRLEKWQTRDGLTARAKLMERLREEPQSTDRINEAASVLFDVMPPGPLKKINKAEILGDWQMIYASDQTALKPFEAGDNIASDEGDELWEVYHRFMEGADVRSINVVRPHGPFTKKAAAVHGEWDLKAGIVRWRKLYIVDAGPLKVPLTSKGSHDWKIAYLSDAMMVLRCASNLESYAVLIRVFVPRGPDLEDALLGGFNRGAGMSFGQVPGIHGPEFVDHLNIDKVDNRRM